MLSIISIIVAVIIGFNLLIYLFSHQNQPPSPGGQILIPSLRLHPCRHSSLSPFPTPSPNTSCVILLSFPVSISDPCFHPIVLCIAVLDKSCDAWCKWTGVSSDQLAAWRDHREEASPRIPHLPSSKLPEQVTTFYHENQRWPALSHAARRKRRRDCIATQGSHPRLCIQSTPSHKSCLQPWFHEPSATSQVLFLSQ